MEKPLVLSKNLTKDWEISQASKSKVVFAFSFLLAGLLILSLVSSEWFRWMIFQYYLNKKDYGEAEQVLSQIVRKRKILGHVDKNFIKEMTDQWEIPMKGLIEKEMPSLENEWKQTRSFFPLSRSLHNKLEFRFERIRNLLEPEQFNEARISERYNRLLSSIQPAFAEFGLAENDMNPKAGALTFNYSGGVALDYNLRSIGVNLGNKIRIVAIRLRRWNQETRVKAENLSLWISKDNRYYLKYEGLIWYGNEMRAINLDHLSFACQYLKIHCDFKDENYTFAEDSKRILEIYCLPDFG